jgi:hypothetical protein
MGVCRREEGRAQECYLPNPVVPVQGLESAVNILFGLMFRSSADNGSA